MSLVARHLEANAIPTVMLASARDITASAFPPRTVFVNYPLGNTAGRPYDVANQREILRMALSLFETATRPGEIVDLPYVWKADDRWMDEVYGDNH